MNTVYDVAVVGNGMIGSAAARYLSAAGLTVAAIGPGEPAERVTHSGVFASHYDQGRITRIIDPDPVWGLLAKRSIAEYQALEEQSGITFHGKVGCLRISPDAAAAGDTLHQAEAVGRDLDAAYTVENTDEGLLEIFPFLHVPAGATALWERGGAGYVNPRQLVQAQLTAAAQNGVTVIAETVTDIAKQATDVTLTTDYNRQVQAQRILISAGAYSSWLLERPLVYQRKAVTVVLAELALAEAERLRALPSIIYRLDNHPVLSSIYSLPPIRYPDGKVYLKIGGPLKVPELVHTPDEIRDWFQGQGNPVEAKALEEVLFAMLPGLAVESIHSSPCVVTYTAHEQAYIGQIDDQVYLATGGCGSSAKSSNEIGRVGALLVEHQGEWHYDVSAENFRICYE